MYWVSGSGDILSTPYMFKNERIEDTCWKDVKLEMEHKLIDGSVDWFIEKERAFKVDSKNGFYINEKDVDGVIMEDGSFKELK